jgi:aromatic ring-opening dioxygenase catalytic subunit (LigB family)
MRFPTLFISHGGGPWPWMEEMKPHMAKSAQWLAGLPGSLPAAPKAIVSVSAHWEGDRFTVSSAAQPPMLYDYYGFPPHTYEVRYPAPGSPELAARIRALLGAAGIDSDEDGERGFDHGTFVPLALAFPKADVPVVAMSLRSGLDPAEHLRMGEALAPLRDEGVLVLGSGLSYHNLRQFGPAGGPASQQFEAWLTDAVTVPDAKTRNARLREWSKAPAARASHPREEHLIPLMVAAGAAQEDRGSLAFVDTIRGIRSANYAFGAA